MNTAQAKRVLETALICSPQPLQARELRALFDDAIGADTINSMLGDLQLDWAPKGVELVQAGVSRAARSCANISTGCIRKSHHATAARRWKRWRSSPIGNR